MTETTEAPARRAKEPDPTCTPNDVALIVDFHGTPVAAQVLREVLGQLGRAAAAASRRQPKNRPEPFGKWNPPHLRLLAELCAELAPEVGSISAPGSYELLDDVPAERADAGIPGTVDHSAAALDEQKAAAVAEPEGMGTYGPTDADRQAAEVARIEADLLAFGASVQPAINALVEQLGAEPVPHVCNRWCNGGDHYELPTLHKPDPVDDAALAAVPVFHKPDPVAADGPPF